MDKQFKQLKTVSPLFIAGALAIVAGGMIAAFTASTPTRVALWASAYLVLVMGVLQILIAFGMLFSLKKLSMNKVSGILAGLNIGALTIILGRVMKDYSDDGRNLVIAGSVVYLAALVVCFLSLKGSQKSWWRFGYIVALSLGFLGALVGLVLTFTLY